jgi:phospholipase/carboxylesterase
VIRSVGRLLALGVVVCGCAGSGPPITRLQARPASPAVSIEPGAHPLGLGGRRDGTLYVPRAAASRTPVPLLVWLHGGGGQSADIHHVFPIAEEYGVAVAAIDSRDNTWDGIDSPYGPDVAFIDAALRHAFARVAVDPRRIALGGLSDGASYSLSLGIANGDLFTHIVAVAPGFVAPPSPPIGRPRIFVAHGTRDNVYSVRLSRNRTVPRLRGDGYDVTYVEFDGPHWVTPEPARRALDWLVR